MNAADFQTLIPANFPTPIGFLTSKLLGFDAIGKTYETLRGMDTSVPLARRLLDHLNVTYKVCDSDLRHIPKTGPVVIVANHPFGLLEGAVLHNLIHGVRPDVRFLANSLVTVIPELRDLVIPIDPFGAKESRGTNGVGLKRAVDWLTSGGVLVIFPAGEVSHFQWKDRCSTDSQWHPAAIRLVELAARTGIPASVVPIYIGGSNSTLFHVAGMVHPKLRTALLPHELLNKRNETVDVRIGSPVEWNRLQNLKSCRERIDYLRWRTYLLANRQQVRTRTTLPLLRRGEKLRNQKMIIEALPQDLLAREVNALPEDCRLGHSVDLVVYIAGASYIPNILLEIGRLREITFRAAGEGTGKACDIDSFDQHYLHLFVWNAKKQELVGAYRLALSDGGAQSLYTRTLFQFDDRFLKTMGPSVELGRSFIRAEYQRGFAPLLLLWKGIGQFIARNPRHKTLFGPVSISNQYQSISRSLMISFLEREAQLSEWVNLVKAHNAPPKTAAHDYCSDLEELSDVVNDIESGHEGVPVLLRQYLRLGGKLLGFNVDPDFANATDGLIVVDLAKTEPKLLERYLGRTEAETFLRFHRNL